LPMGKKYVGGTPSSGKRKKRLYSKNQVLFEEKKKKKWGPAGKSNAPRGKGTSWPQKKAPPGKREKKVIGRGTIVPSKGKIFRRGASRNGKTRIFNLLDLSGGKKNSPAFLNRGGPSGRWIPGGARHKEEGVILFDQKKSISFCGKKGRGKPDRPRRGGGGGGGGAWWTSLS